MTASLLVKCCVVNKAFYLKPIMVQKEEYGALMKKV